MNGKRLSLAVLALSLLLATPVLAQTGRIEGLVARTNGQPVSGVTVLLQEISQVDVSDRDGTYSFPSVPVGTYTVTFTLGNNSVSETGVEVTEGQTTRVETTLEWEIGYAETVTIYSASRRIERVVEAPASVTVVTEAEIEQRAATGQAPKLLEFSPGAQVTQSGIYDFNMNVRGFNSSLNRRVATLIDGRDPSVPFLGAQEWAAVSFPLDDLASVELVRGPSAALYGANASSGVINMTSRQPRYSEGGMVRLTGGQVSSGLADVRWATSLGSDWFVKVVAGVRDTGDFTVSRNVKVEYGGLPLEAVPLAREDDNEVRFGGVRFDKYFRNGLNLTIEGGTASIKGPVFQTGIGRVQVVDAKRPWARFNVNADHWNVALTYTKRDAPDQLALSSGTKLVLDSDRINLEGQTNWDFASDRVRLVVGGSYKVEDIDSRDPDTGRQTLMFAPVDAYFAALFGQVDWRISTKWKLVVASRYDDSDLFESETSPKASVVFSPSPNHNIRLTYNQAFQVPNYSEFFLQADVRAPLDLSAIQQGICDPDGVDCGLGLTRVLALGNESLANESVRMYELGYSGIIGGKAFLTADYYTAENERFITDLLPQLVDRPTTPFDTAGVLNPDFSAWQNTDAANTPSSVIPGLTVEQAVNFVTGNGMMPGTGLYDLGALLSNNPDGSANIAARSYSNAGLVDSQGVDLGLNYYFDNTWTLKFNYSWFDFEVQEAGVDPDQLLPNTPENSAALGVAYAKGRWDWSVTGRWADAFLWSVGPFRGAVQCGDSPLICVLAGGTPSSGTEDATGYTVVDILAKYRLNDSWSFGLNWANALDNVHYQSFGGDLLESRALVSAQFNWD